MEEATNKHNEYGVVIRYLEKACIRMPALSQRVLVKSIQGDFTKFKSLAQEMESFFQDSMMPLF
jgi:hypothetical protein